MIESCNRSRIFKIVLPILSVIITFALLELSARALKSKWGFRNFWLEDQALLKSSYPVEFDPLLGWIPRPNYIGNDNFWRKKVSIDENGIRTNAQDHRNAPSTIILAVGDSFTFGDQVSDGESWPAQLEKQTGKTVINGGVFGYGFDQTYLRMLDLNSRYRPSIIIMQLIPEDIDRCELSFRTSVPKPYFTVEGSGLHLHTRHIKRVEPAPSLLQKAGGYFYVFHEVMERAFPAYWKAGSMKDVRVHDKGDQVATAIIGSLNGFVQDNTNVLRLVVLAQYRVSDKPADAEVLRKLFRGELDRRITVLDTYDALAAVRTNEPAVFKGMYNGHMTVHGNAFIADSLSEFLGQAVASEGERN